MAEPRPTRAALQVHVGYWFDRLHGSKRAQAYSILVPVRERPVGDRVVGNAVYQSAAGMQRGRSTSGADSDGMFPRINL